MMDVSEVRDMTDAQILVRIGEIREELFRLRLRGGMMQLENPRLPRQMRQEIARMRTVIRERELQTETG
jgi:large subunit ribosomal protein L29